jgi:hypothetical protein
MKGRMERDSRFAIHLQSGGDWGRQAAVLRLTIAVAVSLARSDVDHAQFGRQFSKRDCGAREGVGGRGGKSPYRVSRLSFAECWLVGGTCGRWEMGIGSIFLSELRSDQVHLPTFMAYTMVQDF